jgi:hypothetical protein
VQSAEITFGLCEIVIIKHRRWDLVPMLVEVFVKITVSDSISLEESLKVDVFVGWNSWVVDVWHGGKKVIINNVELRQDMATAYVANVADSAGVLP